MVVRASNLQYGEDACAYIAPTSSRVTFSISRATSRHPTARSHERVQCVHGQRTRRKSRYSTDPTVWTLATAVTDAQTAVNAYGSSLKAIYSQWSGPIPSTIYAAGEEEPHGQHDPDRRRRAFRRRCATSRAVPRAPRVSARQPLRGGGARVRARRGERRQAEGRRARRWCARAPGRRYAGDTNLGDPIVAPFVTKTAEHVQRHGPPGAPASSARRSATRPCGATPTARPTAECATAHSRPVDEPRALPSR